MQIENQKTEGIGGTKISTLMPEVRDNQSMYFRRI
jgi:hypothetical protein